MALSVLLLILFMFAFTWFGVGAAPGRAPTSINGWNALTHIRWLAVVTILVAIASVYFQAARRAPAIPAALDVIVLVLAILTTLALIYRVGVNPPGTGLARRAGAFLGLAASLGIVYGSFASLRQEGVRTVDGPQEIERVSLEHGSAQGTT